ncbi:MAG: O-antigen polymerase [Candidatus Nomurabacteria bacterium GW2011_GWA1_35_8]|uniref:O-antigen polymerase n=1 Tax=Candidatus Nomurabacteria bacterium GW2011_GWA1_35_8 TaxID=1618727 RepID=A0A0G0CUG3_9BACT|nr:MAG: O-antigen polymerase [Candidatus Nomurabacteria bacterium GW2011_GWA1_35_8]
MEINFYKFLKISKFLLFTAVFTPLIYANNLIYPYLTGKMLFFRLTVGLALIFFAAYKIFIFETIGDFKKYLKDIFKTYSRNPLILAVSIFFISLLVSTIFAVNPYQAFWGNLDRGEGFINLLHYLTFAFLIAAVFNSRDWLKFFSVSLIVGLVVIFYGFFQWLGIDFPFMPVGSDSFRPGSFIGNPAFLAAYLILLIAVSGVVKSSADKRHKILAYSTAILGLILIFITRTRGALVGIFIGLLVLLICGIFSANKKIKNTAIIFLFVLLGIGIVFTFTYRSQFWQNIPGFDRISESVSYANDASIQTRLIAWQSSLEAFKENPIFGWGLEDYLTAYSKYYNPHYVIFGETWLDRAHNKFIDVLVMQGLFGLAAYLAVLAAIFWVFRKRPLIFAALFAYVSQNFFVFEEINSYILFYSFLGFGLFSFISAPTAADYKNSESENELSQKFKLQGNGLYKLSTFALFLFAFLVWGYFYNYIPYRQAKFANLAFNTAPIPENQETIIWYLQKAFEPYNFSQTSIRSLLFDKFHNVAGGFNVFENSQFGIISKEIEGAIDDEIARFPNYDPRFYLRKYQILFAMAKQPGKEILFAEAEPVIKKGIEMAPKRQEFYYGLAFVLAGQNRYQESIDAAQYAVKLEPRAPRSYYHLGIMYAIAQRKPEALKALEVVYELDSDFSALYQFDSDGLLLTYKILGSFDKIADLAVWRVEGKNMLNISLDDYLSSLQYLAEIRDEVRFIKIAKYLAQMPKLKDDMEVLIDLAEKGNWDIINKL